MQLNTSLSLHWHNFNYYYYCKQARFEGINDFVLNEELPWYTKSVLHQKSEDKQVKLLVEQKQAFSAGTIWVALGSNLMGFKATIKPQVTQIEKEKASAAEMATKKASNLCVKLKNAGTSFEVFKLGGKTSLEAWQDIVRLLVPLYNKKTAPSKFSWIVKIKEKLNSFVVEFGSSWNELMGIQLKQFQSRLLSKASGEDATKSSFWAKLHLDSDSEGNTDEDGDEAAV